ncbi:hypothetical protein [Streptomyces sp. KR55]
MPRVVSGRVVSRECLRSPAAMTWADYDGALELRSHARSWFDRFFFYT